MGAECSLRILVLGKNRDPPARLETPPACLRGSANRRGRRTRLCGGEGSYRGLGAEGGGAMLERVGTVAVRSGGGGSLTHAPHWVDGPRSSLWGEENTVIYSGDS